MLDATQPTADREEPTSTAELTVGLTPDDVSLSARLPGKNARDLLAIVVVVGTAVGPPAMVSLAGGEPMPWWAILAISLGQLAVIALTIYLNRRRCPGH